MTRTLRSRSWRVLRIWEHELARKHERRVLRRLQRRLVPPGQAKGPARFSATSA